MRACERACVRARARVSVTINSSLGRTYFMSLTLLIAHGLRIQASGVNVMESASVDITSRIAINTNDIDTIA